MILAGRNYRAASDMMPMLS